MKIYFCMIVGAALIFSMVGCANTAGDVSTGQVRSIQAEAKKGVPKDLETIPVEKAQAGVANPSAAPQAMGKGIRGR